MINDEKTTMEDKLKALLTKRNFGILAAVVILGLGLGYFFGNQQDKPKEEKAVAVKTMTVGKDGDEGKVNYAGVVRGRYETNMSFQVGGQLLSRNIKAGDRVAAGQVLMVIDARDILQKANQGDAAVTQAKAQLDLASANLSRYQQLYAEHAIAAAVLDQYQTAYDAAAATYNQAVAQSVQGHNALGYTNLTAPADGVITAVQAEAGQVVAAGQQVLTFVRGDSWEIEINVPEDQLALMPVGKDVDVTFWALQGVKVRGIVREVAAMADSASRTYKVRVAVPEPPAGMSLGMTANVTAAGENTRTEAGKITQLPLTAVYQTGDTPSVWLVKKDNTVTLQPVQVVSFGKNDVNVTGLKDGDVVVTAGVQKLREGLAVRVMEASEP